MDNENNNKSDSEDDENCGKYTEKELKIKLEGNHLYNEPYNKYFDDDEEIYEDEKEPKFKKKRNKNISNENIIINII